MVRMGLVDGVSLVRGTKLLWGRFLGSFGHFSTFWEAGPAPVVVWGSVPCGPLGLKDDRAIRSAWFTSVTDVGNRVRFPWCHLTGVELASVGV